MKMIYNSFSSLQWKTRYMTYFRMGLMLFLILGFKDLQAVTKITTGNGNWNNPATWSPSGVPASDDSIVINHNISLNVDIELIAGGKLTINSGASLIGDISTRRIGYTLSNSGPSVRVTNYGTLTIGRYNRSASGGNSNDDHYFDNFGIFNLTDNIDCNGSASAFAIAWGVFTNHSGAVINCSPCFYVGGATSLAEFHNSGEIFFNCSTCSGAFSAHSTATIVNHPGGKITAVELMTMGGLDQHNYGCINALGGIRVFEKSNNAGNGTFTLHDDSKIFVPSGQQFNVNSNTTLTGVDDDNNNANNACVSTQTNVSNSGTITGEFYLNDPDGLVSGTVGPNVVLGTGNCGGACASATCAISGVSATPGACNSGTNQYTLTGNVTFTNAPSSGTLTVSVSGGGSQIFNSPFTSPVAYSIAGLISDGASHTVTAVFSADPSCTNNASYTAPASCSTPCPSLNILPNSLNNPIQGVSYNESISVNGGVAPYTWTLVNNTSLPSGLNLSSMVGTTINVIGTPYFAGVYNLSLEVSDFNGCKDTIDYLITVNAPSCSNLPPQPILWVIDEDATKLHLWSFEDYTNPTTTAKDYGRMKYSVPGFSGSYNFNNGSSPDMEAFAINPTSGMGYFLLAGRIKVSDGAPTDGPSGHVALFSYDLNNAVIDSGNIVLNLIGHLKTGINGVAYEAMTFDPSTNRLYFADPVGSGQNNDLLTDTLKYIALSSLNPNPLLGTIPNVVGAIEGLGETNKYVDGMEMDEYGNLFTVDGTDDDVYIIDKNSGTIIGVHDNNVIGGLASSTDIETLVWDPINNKLLGVDNDGFKIINIASGNGTNNVEGTYYPGTPGMIGDEDFEGAAMWVTCLSSPSCIPPSAGSDLSAIQGNCINLSGTSPSTGTWSALVGNPSGATLGTTTAGVAQVCFSGSALGSYGFIYSISSGCEDTMYVVVNSSPTSPCSNSTLWAINEDDGHLFSVLNWSSQTGVNTTTTDWGLIKWSTNNCATSTNINASGGSELESAAWDGTTNEYYFTSNKTLGSFSKPVLLKLDMDNLVPGQQPCAVVIGSIATGGADIESLAIDPATGILYGGSKNGGDLYRINRNTASIESGYPVQMVKPGGGNLNNSESMTFDFNGNLYVSETDDKDVYIIDKVTGLGISTYDNNTAPLGLDGITWDFSGDRLIGFEDNSANGFSNLIEITPGNGNNTTFANTFSAGLVDIEGLELACPKVGLACLGNYVWNDFNLNGIQDNTEVGVAGITISLLNNSNQLIGTTVTDAYGYYSFCQLTPGTYKIQVTLPANYSFTNQNSGSDDNLDNDVNNSNGISDPVTLALGDNNFTLDAGIFFTPPQTASVGNFVWLDNNQDGVQDSGEPGIGGVTVMLKDNSGVVVATTITDATGFYIFTNVNPGQYSVQFNLLPGMNFSPNSGAVSSPMNSDAGINGMTSLFTVVAGDEINYVDAGMFNLSNTVGSIGDRVWYDKDQDGIQDVSEFGGVANILVTLFAANGTTVIATTYTNTYGEYIFNNLAAGQYVVGFSGLPLNYSFTTNAGTDSTTNSDADPVTGKTTVINLLAGQVNMTIDAGLFSTISTNTNALGDFVWNDVNQNGIQDPGEAGVVGVTVTLYDANTNTPISTTSTNSEGMYIFSNLPDGTYYVGFSNLPPGFIFSSSGQGSSALDSDPDPSTGLTSNVSLSGGVFNNNIDAGVNLANTRIGLATLGDVVWYDLNNNGLQDPNEGGVSGVTVTLYQSNGTTVLQTTNTDAIGNYIFTGLSAGSYIVGFSNIPSGFTITLKNADNAGNEGELNSDVNPGTQKTDLVSLGIGEDKMSIDMGLIQPVGSASVGNFVWFDLNNDGLQTSGEPGVTGISVTLYNNLNEVIASTTTDASGFYQFVGLNPGEYNIRFSNLPSGYIFSVEDADLSGINGTNNSDANDLNGQTENFTLIAGDNNLNIDAGIISTTVGSVGNFVWNDINQNGLQDPGEPGIGGILVTLFDNSNNPVASTITRPDGTYQFTNVVPGNYTISFTNTPSNMEFTQVVGNTTDDNNSNVLIGGNSTGVFTVVAGQYNPTIDAGLITSPSGQIGNYVWFDFNANGIQDPSEYGIPGVTVTLFDQLNNVIGTTVTSGNGAYLFSNLPQGQYYVCFTDIPVLYTPQGTVMIPSPTPADSGNDLTDSDISSNGCTGVYSLSAGETNITVDAGFVYQFPTPIQLSYFILSSSACSIKLEWLTSSESNLSHFELLRKGDDGKEIQLENFIAAGNSQTDHKYQYNDQNLKSGNYAYRLKIVDKEGKFSYSNSVFGKLNCDGIGQISIYPNPTDDYLDIKFDTQTPKSASIIVYDELGQVLRKMNFNQQASNSGTFTIYLGDLATGFYTLKVVDTETGDQSVFKINKR